jgi:LPS export ABC transporter protein LptC
MRRRILIRNKAKKTSFFSALFCLTLVSFLLIACSFDYGAGNNLEDSRPDIVMENIEYVRVRGGNILARFNAEYAERWENRQIMELRNFTFEQMEDKGETVNVIGSAARAEVQIESGDISLFDGVTISIESEDLIITTSGLEWKDKEKILTGGVKEEVEVQRSDGTIFTGIGFSADIRHRTWAFSGESRGSYVEEEDEDVT